MWFTPVLAAIHALTRYINIVFAPIPPSPYRLFGDWTVWDEVYGFDMSVIKEIALTEPLVDVVEGKVRSDAYVVILYFFVFETVGDKQGQGLLCVICRPCLQVRRGL